MKTVNSGLKLISLLVGLLGLFVSTAIADVDCDKWRPPTVSFNNRVNWDIDMRGLINVFFDTDQNGKVDFIAIYRQSRQAYGISTPSVTPEEIRKRFPNNPIISTKEDVVLKENKDYIPSSGEGILESRSEYGKKRYSHYVVKKHPHYYILDRNEDGLYEIIYQDGEEDGFNGNETLEHCPQKGEKKKYYIPNPEEMEGGKPKEYEVTWPPLDQAVKDGTKYLD